VLKRASEKAAGRPLIGITMRHEIETERFYLARFYSEAVAAAGGTPVHVSLIPDRAYVESVASRLDGVLLPGSASDVDPARYGRDPHRMLGQVHPLRDETDALLLDYVEREGVPLLAICYGMQALNVHRGGTLIQDIAAQLPEAFKHEQGAPRDRPSHRIKLLENSLLSQLNDGALSTHVNSHHHQALEKVGRDLQATAWTGDGLIEAVEETRKGRWALGVQWHPEIGWERDDFARAMFEKFISEAAHAASDKVKVEKIIG
jgi:putative glutamine amidotransferase